MLSVPSPIDFNDHSKISAAQWIFSSSSTTDMDRLPIAAIIVLVSLLVTIIIVLVLGTVYTVYYS